MVVYLFLFFFLSENFWRPFHKHPDHVSGLCEHSSSAQCTTTISPIGPVVPKVFLPFVVLHLLSFVLTWIVSGTSAGYSWPTVRDTRAPSNSTTNIRFHLGIDYNVCFFLLCNLFCFLVGAYPAEYQYRHPVYLTPRSGLYDRSAHTPPLPPSEPAVTCQMLIVFCFCLAFYASQIGFLTQQMIVTKSCVQNVLASTATTINPTHFEIWWPLPPTETVVTYLFLLSSSVSCTRCCSAYLPSGFRFVCFCVAVISWTFRPSTPLFLTFTERTLGLLVGESLGTCTQPRS